ncbi:MAG: OsmC family protein [Flavobacteriales bacterium]
MKTHYYSTKVEWTGNKGSGTFDYRAYSRDHIISGTGKTTQINGSSDSAFYGDSSRYNPEDLLIASLSSCHMLWYLHLCVNHGIIVINYMDQAEGVLQENSDGSGQFKEVTLKPTVTINKKENIDLALQLHKKANKMCFIANSCNFKINHEPIIKIVS